MIFLLKILACLIVGALSIPMIVIGFFISFLLGKKLYEPFFSCVNDVFDLIWDD